MPKILQTILFEDFKAGNKELFFNSDIVVLKTSYTCPLEGQKWETLIDMLPVDLKKEVEKYVRWQDQHNTLIGKLLVYLAYSILKGERLNFERYKRDKYNKPFLKDSSFNFNISHSGKTVVCAISRNGIKLGIDIEEIKKIDINGFKNIFHPNEFNKITQTKDVEEFYKYWTRKEAFTKAIGKGIVLPLGPIDTTKKIISKNKDDYYIESHLLDKLFCSLVCNKNESQINWIDIKF